MNPKTVVTFTLFIFYLHHCAAQEVTVKVKNTLDFARKEVVAINRKGLSGFLKANDEKQVRIRKAGSGAYLPVQWIDYDGDGTNDELLFVAEVASRSTAEYTLVFDSAIPQPGTEAKAYSRFVPERSDDFAWENNRVAFRVYGTKGQEEAVKGVPGSTLSSGVDIWLKRVHYPIIDKWYAGHVASPGYYHTDRGEGYDPYHVGASRGTGGSGVWVKDSLQVADNFKRYRIIAQGPLRTVFELDYGPWGDFGIRETKRITLDIDTNFSKFEVSVSSESKLPNYAVGITLHKNEGEVKLEKEKGWFRHWEKIGDAYVGEGIVADPTTVQSAFANVSKSPDQSNLIVLLQPKSTIVYYAGFAWEKSGQVKNASDWDAMLERQAEVIANPMEVKM